MEPNFLLKGKKEQSYFVVTTKIDFGLFVREINFDMFLYPV